MIEDGALLIHLPQTPEGIAVLRIEIGSKLLNC